MAHLPYADLEQAHLQPLVQRIVAGRGSVLHLYQMLLHSPPLAEGWLHFMTQVRQKLTLSAALRELVIMRIAYLNGAPYEAEQHLPLALAEGLSQAQMDALPMGCERGDGRDGRAADAAFRALFSPLQCDVLRLCDAMTREVQVDKALLQAVRDHLGERQVVELVATIASYNMVSRFLEALQIHSDDTR
jgi:alkylhydroperoxidase family enzyme